MTMFHKSWTWRCQTNHMGACGDMCWDRPNTRHKYMVLSLHNVYILSLDLRLSYVLKMWINLSRGYQTLLRNRIVIKVAFGFVKKHAMRHSQSRWDLPLSAWVYYIRLRVNLVRDSESQDREREVSLELDRISWGKGKSLYMELWWFVWYDHYVRIGVDTSCRDRYQLLGWVGVLGPCLYVCEPIGSHTYGVGSLIRIGSKLDQV